MISDDFKEIFNASVTPDGRNLVFDFFITFSRFECALKNSIRYARINGLKVAADWTRFASSIQDTFDKTYSPELDAAVEYIINNPPKVQHLENNQLVWHHLEIENNTPLTTRLDLYIRTIRNNLFHGGKFNGVYEPDISRNYILISNAMIILNDWLRLNEVVRILFLERMD